jgi:hypothetical protein
MFYVIFKKSGKFDFSLMVFVNGKMSICILKNITYTISGHLLEIYIIISYLNISKSKIVIYRINYIIAFNF